jgi:pimeloyl-ACP methyl ester carboxylesterase/DNA-binding SARP family transcriptional activator
MRLRLLGTVAVANDDGTVPLPRSRKTRALLAYLAVSERPVRRERLCELLWDLPDDPRGALRWSLSRVRAILGDAVVADRETVGLDHARLEIDYQQLRKAVERGLAGHRVDELESLAAMTGTFLEGLELARCDSFNAWRVAVAEDAHRWNCAVWAELATRDLPPERLLPFARAWVECAPADPDAQANLLRLLDLAGRLEDEASGNAAPRPAAPEQDIRFCRSRDGTMLAYAELGHGPPVVKAANWHTNLEQDFDSPAWPHWIRLFSADHRFIRYDERGNGLSDWDCAITHDGFVEDLECVVDAAGVDRFDLVGISHGASVAIRYAVKHPERVRRMILWGAYAAGWAVSARTEDREQRELIWSLTKAGWALEDSALRTLFTATFLPDASPEQVAWFNEFQRTNSSLENTLVIQQLLPTIDVRDCVAKVTTPTLVGHSTRDAVVPFAEARALAAQLPGARFLAVDSANHLLLDGEPGWPKFASAARDFLG